MGRVTEDYVDTDRVIHHREGGQQGKLSHKEWKMCRRKTRYDNPHTATRFAKTYGGGMHAYDCPVCSGYHIGHSRRRS